MINDWTRRPASTHTHRETEGTGTQGTKMRITQGADDGRSERISQKEKKNAEL